jgi:hypothetical protein
MKTFKYQIYNPPEELKERFDYLVSKIEYAKENNWLEMYCGYTVMLKSEFEKYKVKLYD